MSSPRPLILIHIPRTAGTTLSRMLRLHLGLWPPANWLHHGRALGYYHLGYARPEHLEARLRRIEALTPAQRNGVRFFAAHAGYGLRERLPPDMRATAAYITVLREPVARVISTFQHLQLERRLPADATLEQYIAMRKHFGLFKFDNAQTRYLAGENGVAIDVPVGEVTPDMLQTARRRLERDIAWFGLTERFDESVLLLADMLGWRRPRYARARVSEQRGEESVAPELLEKIRQFNALDVELYRHAMALFESRLAAQSQDFPARVARFRAANARHARLLAPLTAALPTGRRLLQRAGLLR